MDKIGAILKQTREDNNLSLNKVINDLKVSRNFIEKIEDDNFEDYLDKAYLIGHVRAYSNYLNLDANEIIKKAASVICNAPMHVVALPGNHDPATPGSPWYHRSMKKAENLHILGVTHKQAVLLKELDLEIWGRAHRDYGDMRPLNKPRSRTSRWQVALAHGHYEPVVDRKSILRPSWLFSDRDLKATSADYVALGHWNRAVRVGDGSVPAYYSGSPDYAKTVNVIRLSKKGEVKVRRRKIS